MNNTVSKADVRELNLTVKAASPCLCETLGTRFDPLCEDKVSQLSCVSTANLLNHRRLTDLSVC